MAMALPNGFRKALLYVFAGLTCFVIIRLGLHAPSNDHKSTRYWSSLINDPSLQLRGLIYVLKTFPDRTLPDPVDENALLTPYVLGIQDYVQPSEWKRKIMASENESPLVVFSKTYCPYSHAAKVLLENYDVEPRPFIVEANLRNDTMLIKHYLTRLTGQATFPNIILKGRSLGGSDDLRELARNKELKPVLEVAGLVVKGSSTGPVGGRP